MSRGAGSGASSGMGSLHITAIEEEIRARMALYFDGLHFSDARLLAQVFHPAARYVCATGGEFIDLAMEDYLPMVAAREAPAVRGEPRRDEIVRVLCAGPETALVEARCAIGRRYFTDYLSFVRVAEGWRIVAKVFHYDLLREAQ